ncbi:MAG: DUF4337 domain-containing protein [Verrucomicrobia bacterium]|nr:DUF4337 domain-containing protein [Verrucomicrobiota bacterium]
MSLTIALLAIALAVVFCSLTLLTQARSFFHCGLLLSAVGGANGLWAFFS